MTAPVSTYLTYNGTDLGSTYNLLVTNPDALPYRAPVRFSAEPLAQGDGSVAAGGSLEAFEVWFRCAIVNVSSDSARETALSGLLTALAAGEAQERALVASWMATRTYQARFLGVRNLQRASNGAILELGFFIGNPNYTEA